MTPSDKEWRTYLSMNCDQDHVLSHPSPKQQISIRNTFRTFYTERKTIPRFSIHFSGSGVVLIPVGSIPLSI